MQDLSKENKLRRLFFSIQRKEERGRLTKLVITSLILFSLILFSNTNCVTALPNEAENRIDFTYEEESIFNNATVNNTLRWNGYLWNTVLELNGVTIDDWSEVNGSGGSSVSFGNPQEIPVTNAGGDDFDYTSNFKFDETYKAMLIGGTAVGSGQPNMNFGKGLFIASDGFPIVMRNEDTTFGTGFLFERSRGTYASQSNLNTNDIIGFIQFRGRITNYGIAHANLQGKYLGSNKGQLIFGTSDGSGVQQDIFTADVNDGLMLTAYPIKINSIRF